MTSQIESIRASFVGAFYTRFSIGDGLDLYFDDFVLSSREVVSPDEQGISAALAGVCREASLNPSWECVAVSVIAAACVRTPVLFVELLADSSLLIGFANNLSMRLPTDTPVVDWHWAITESGGDPYTGCYIACFSPGDVQGNMRGLTRQVQHQEFGQS